MIARNLARLSSLARPVIGRRLVHKGAEVTPPHNFFPFWVGLVLQTFPATLTLSAIVLWSYPMWVIHDVKNMRPYEEPTLGDQCEGVPKTWAEHLARQQK